MKRADRPAAKKNTNAKTPDVIFALALEHHAAGRLDLAETLYRKILLKTPGRADVHSNLGAALEGQGRLKPAEASFRRAAKLNPGSALIRFNLGNVLSGQNRLEEAAECYREATALQPDYPQAHNNLGIAFKRMEKPEEAAAHYEKAIALKPDYPQAHNNLGNVLKEQGRFPQAKKMYEKALALQPDYPEAHYNLAELTHFKPGDPHIKVLETLVTEGGVAPEKRHYLHFALAKAADDTGDYNGAFRHWLEANALKRRQIRYDEAAMRNSFLRIADTFDARLIERFQGAGDPSQVPIFILGMPRSGSTLVEQVLASHPQVHGAGELDNLNRIAGSLGMPYPDAVPRLTPAGFRGLGEAYLKGLPPLPPGKTRITDKRPLNFLHIGLIKLILPHARIIHTLRDPLDTCLSCFSKPFASELNFTYSLPELGRYYRLYRDLMAHWRSVLPGAFLDVAYEDVVQDLEGQTRRLLKYCGLPWDARCLDFHQTDRVITTASALQARQPLYRDALNRRRHYEAHLEPLMAELAQP